MSKVRVEKKSYTEMVPVNATKITIELPLEVAVKLYKLCGYPIELWSLRDFLGDALADPKENVTYPRHRHNLDDTQSPE